jgi:hypothetical protein
MRLRTTLWRVGLAFTVLTGWIFGLTGKAQWDKIRNCPHPSDGWKRQFNDSVKTRYRWSTQHPSTFLSWE